MMEGKGREVVWGEGGLWGLGLEWEDKMGVGFLFFRVGRRDGVLGLGTVVGGGHNRLMIFGKLLWEGGKRASGWRWWFRKYLGHE